MWTAWGGVAIWEHYRNIGFDTRKFPCSLELALPRWTLAGGPSVLLPVRFRYWSCKKCLVRAAVALALGEEDDEMQTLTPWGAALLASEASGIGRMVGQAHAMHGRGERMIDPPLVIIGSDFCTRNKGALAFRANTRS